MNDMKLKRCQCVSLAETLLPMRGSFLYQRHLILEGFHYNSMSPRCVSQTRDEISFKGDGGDGG
jgi:hypothetical protein